MNIFGKNSYWVHRNESKREKGNNFEKNYRRKWLPTPVFLPGESHGQRSLAAYSPWGCKELDTTERLTLSLLHLYEEEIELVALLG